MRSAIFICDNPVETFWQLGQISISGGNFVLLGWRTYPTSVDEGVPDAVAEVLASAMSSLAQVIFLSSDPALSDAVNEWNFSGDEAVCVLKEPNPLKQFAAILSGKQTNLVLRSSRKPKVIKQLFDDGLYPWWMQGQIVFLSEPERALPEIDRQTLLSLFEDDWIMHALKFQSIGVQSVLRPGVDGCVAGILFLTDAFRQMFLEILENQSRAAGFGWKVLSEDDFASSLADSQK